jgi:restriction system protein
MQAFVVRMQVGDWVVIPSKVKPSITFAEVTGGYTFDKKGDDPYYHFRTVKWIAQDVPRSAFNQDLLYSFGAFSTVCQIQRNDAEKRIKAMAAVGFSSSTGKTKPVDEELGTDGPIDLEEVAQDQIAKVIIAKFKGHGLARLVGSILRSQGYTVHESPPGPDKGVDLLAAPGPLGFGRPRICVQVKSGDTPVDLPALNQLVGAMHNSKAEQGLFVSWGGFKSSVDKETASQFFQVRLWNQSKLIEELLANYDTLDASLRAELPLKRVWTIAMPEEEEA